MTSTLSQLLGKSSGVASASTRRLQEEGVSGFFSAASSRTRYLSVVALFDTLFDSMTREELIERAKQDGKYWEYGSAETVNYQNQDADSVPDLFREYSGSYDVERPFVCELHRGWLINATDPFVLTRNRELVMETEKPLFGPRDIDTPADTPFHKRTEYSERTPSERMVQLCRGYVQARDWFNEEAQFESVFPLIRRAPSYAHWMVDQLPTVRGLKRYQAATDRDPTVLIEPDPPDWILETLSLVGVDNPVPFDMSVAKTDRLIVSSCRESVPRNQSVYEPSREDIDWLTGEMKSRVSASSTDYPDRIYISRENLSGRGRDVTNREELHSVLKEFDIEVFTPETLSIAEQIRLYGSANLIVGPHGAGLTNMIFAEDASVVELLSTRYPMYQHLAQVSGHDYQFVQCGDGKYHHASIEINPTALRSVLAGLDNIDRNTD